MPNLSQPRLCAGTFFTLLLEAKKPRQKVRAYSAGDSDGLSNTDILCGLIQIINPSFVEPYGSSFKTLTSDFRLCRVSSGTYLPFGNDVDVIRFSDEIESSFQIILERVAIFVNKYIDTNPDNKLDTWLAKGLLALIDSDSTIGASDIVYFDIVGNPINKSDLSNLHEINLYCLILGIIYFILTQRPDNTIGKDTIDLWCPPDHRRNRRYRGDIGNHFDRNIILKYGPGPIESVESKTKSNYPTETSAEIKDYLNKANLKYDVIKTLLYSDSPQPFYSFYVCNDIKYRKKINKRHTEDFEIITISNVDASELAELSRFVILSGTGGLGKSMMMRHLLLNSIMHYDETKLFPIFITLKDYDESASSLFDFIFEKIDVFGSGITKETLYRQLESGNCLLLFDGLDEIGTKHAEFFDTSLEEFTDRYPLNQYVISSRPAKSFVSYARFTVLQLCAFSKDQALSLIDKLDFRADEPSIKQKFREAIDKRLYWSHKEFVENPLLLTIMLMTFEQFADIPSKMHIFYREAFTALAQKHDASKGAYKRVLRTGLTIDRFADYFAEFCARTYHDEKYELSELEFESYFDILNENKKDSSDYCEAHDFLYDLCANMCLMYSEGGKFHFTHRSFQEYFCALYFSRQKDKHLHSIGLFFEHQKRRNYGDKTFNMLYDMIPAKIEEYIFLPYLSNLHASCEEGEGYWTFLEILYPDIYYEKGDTDSWFLNLPSSYLFDFIRLEHFPLPETFDRLPFYENLVTEEYCYIEDEDEGETKLVCAENITSDYIYEYGQPDIVGWKLEFNVSEILRERDKYGDLIRELSESDFHLKIEYEKSREYLEELIKRQEQTSENLFDLFV